MTAATIQGIGRRFTNRATLTSLSRRRTKRMRLSEDKELIESRNPRPRGWGEGVPRMMGIYKIR